MSIAGEFVEGRITPSNFLLLNKRAQEGSLDGPSGSPAGTISGKGIFISGATADWSVAVAVLVKYEPALSIIGVNSVKLIKVPTDDPSCPLGDLKAGTAPNRSTSRWIVGWVLRGRNPEDAEVRL